MDEKALFSKILGIRLPWFVRQVSVNEAEQRVDIFIDHEPNIQVRCPECDEFFGLYDHAPERVYRHLNTCQMATYVHVRPPRVKCPRHGVKQADSEIGEHGSNLSYALESWVIRVAQECSIEAVGRLCGISWGQGWHTLERAVERGRARKPRRLPVRLGVDEKSLTRGHRYETLVYDLEAGTVEYVGDDRGQASLEAYWRQFSEEARAQVEAVAMDMWDPYIAATKAYVPQAEEKIVFDRFHVMRQLLEAVDKVRKAEHKQLAERGEQALKGTKYLWLWNEEHIPQWRREEFDALRAQDLRICRAWAIKENLRHLWETRSIPEMRAYFTRWYDWAVHSRLEPIIKAAKTLRRHLENIITFAQHRITNALGENINARIERFKRLACGFRNRDHYRTAIYFHCAGLKLFPQPPAHPSIRFKPYQPLYIGGIH
jgi:transposase